MALRDKLAERAAPFLEPGEQVHHVFMGQTGMSPYMAFLSYLFLWKNKYYVVATTDRATLVMKAGFMAPSKPKELSQRLGRGPFGPMTGLWGKTEFLGAGNTMYVHKRFHKDVEAADAELGGGGGAFPA